MIFLTLFFFSIIVGYPVWDYFYMKKINNNLIHKWRIYWQTMVTQWILVIIFLTYWFLTKHSFNELFFLESLLFSFQTEDILAFGLGIGISIVMLVMIVSFSQKIRRKIAAVLAEESIQFLIPKTFGDRLLFLFVAITAGFCEEIIFRGAMLYYLSNLSYELSIITIGIISSMLFGIIHLYQGWKGVLQTTYLGGVLFFLYVGTGSLWIPIVLHIIVDVKFVFLPNIKNADSSSDK